MPVASAEREVPLILPTVVAQEPAEVVVSPVRAGSCAQDAEPVRPLNGAEVAAMLPVPLAVSDPPVPITRAAAFVPPVMAENAVAPAEAAVSCAHTVPLYWQATTLVPPPTVQSVPLEPSVTTAMVPFVLPETLASPATVVIGSPPPLDAPPVINQISDALSNWSVQTVPALAVVVMVQEPEVLPPKVTLNPPTEFSTNKTLISVKVGTPTDGVITTLVTFWSTRTLNLE